MRNKFVAILVAATPFQFGRLFNWKIRSNLFCYFILSNIITIRLQDPDRVPEWTKAEPVMSLELCSPWPNIYLTIAINGCRLCRMNELRWISMNLDEFRWTWMNFDEFLADDKSNKRTETNRGWLYEFQLETKVIERAIGTRWDFSGWDVCVCVSFIIIMITTGLLCINICAVCMSIVAWPLEWFCF